MSFPAEIHLKYIRGKRLKKHRISGAGRGSVGSPVMQPLAAFLISWFCLRFKGGWQDKLMSPSQGYLFQVLVKGNTSGSQLLLLSGRLCFILN